MPIVGMPDGTKVQFPDDMPDEQIRGMISQKFPDAVKAIAPPQSGFWQDYQDMRQEAQSLIGSGIEQAQKPTTADQITGAFKVGMGGLGYVASPINAAIRTVVGRPVESLTGVPKEYTEFAAGLALPVPKRIPLPARGQPKPAPMTTEKLFEEADRGYDAARSSEFIAPPGEVAALRSGIDQELREAGYRPVTAKKTFRLVGDELADGSKDAGDLIATRTAINKISKPEEADAVRRTLEQIDDYLEPRVTGITEARGNYAAGKRSQMLEEQANIARIKSESPTGPTIDTALRQRARAILTNKQLRRGLSEDEIAQLNKINKGTFIGNSANYISGLLKGAGSMKTILPVVTGGMSTLAASGVDQISGAITRGQFAKLQQAVASRSPAGRAAEASLGQWAEAKQAFDVSPSVKAFVKFSIASRNLSNTLKGSDVSIDPEGLLRLIQTPAASFDERFAGSDAQP
jgi:hypothetical protein